MTIDTRFIDWHGALLPAEVRQAYKNLYLAILKRLEEVSS